MQLAFKQPITKEKSLSKVGEKINTHRNTNIFLTHNGL